MTNIGRPRKGEYRICKHCGKRMYCSQTDIKRGKQFCCRLCVNKYQKGSRHPLYKSKIYFNCECCGKELKQNKAAYNSSKHHYCSVECCDKKKGEYYSGENHHQYDKSKHIVFPCDSCGKDVVEHKVTHKRSKSHFCSNSCHAEYVVINNLRSLEKHPSWLGGISRNYSRDFKKIRNTIIDKYGGMCIECGKTKKDTGVSLSVHHIDYNTDNNSSDNLVPLCWHCHGKTNYNREYWKDYFLSKKTV